MSAPPTSAPPQGEIARRRRAAAAGEAILVDSATAPVLLSAATAERSARRWLVRRVARRLLGSLAGADHTWWHGPRARFFTRAERSLA
jgi:hypothetical protein